MRTVWANCGLGPNDEVFAFWNELGRELTKAGVRLRVFGVEGDYSACDGFTCDVTGVSTISSEWDNVPPVSDDAQLANELIGLEQAWAGSPGMLAPADKIENVLRACEGWKRRLLSERPCAILPWGTALPKSRLLLRLAERMYVPHWVVERGPLPHTIDLSSYGQGALVATNMQPNYSSFGPDDGRLAQRFCEILHYYSDRTHGHYSGYNVTPSPDLEAKLLASPGKRVLFLGSADLGAQVRLAPLGLAEACSPHLRSTQDAAVSVAESLEALGSPYTLWIKPHPTSYFELPATSPAVQVLDCDIRWLIENADVVVSLVTTAQFYAVLYGKPQVVLGSGPLLGHGIAYEAYSKEAYKACLHKALERDDFEGRDIAGKRLLSKLFDDHLVGTNDRVPTRLRITDAARMIARFAQIGIGEERRNEYYVAPISTLVRSIEAQHAASSAENASLQDKLTELAAGLGEVRATLERMDAHSQGYAANTISAIGREIGSLNQRLVEQEGAAKLGLDSLNLIARDVAELRHEVSVQKAESQSRAATVLGCLEEQNRQISAVTSALNESVWTRLKRLFR